MSDDKLGDNCTMNTDVTLSESDAGNENSCNIRAITSDQTEMLEALSRIPELRVKSQQISEADLTKEQKLDVLKEIFSFHPMQFLTRFGEHLEPSQLKCFDEFKEDENILLYIKQLERNISSDARKLRAKNRRYAALQKLVDTTDYFTEELMQRRNPILFDQLIGRFHTKDERNAFLARSEQIASTSSTTPLTDLLMAHLDRNEDGQSYRRLDQEQQKADEDEADQEYLDRMDDDEDMDDDRPGPSQPGRNGGVEAEDGEEIEDEEKELLKEEFFTTMYRDFLEGRDADFDYSTVDNNDEYDVGENLEQDEEEKYFGDEEPLDINSESNSEMDEMFRPPVRSSEIESKIQTLTVTNGIDNSSTTQNMPSDKDDDDEDDELDAYMRTIERELQNK